MECGCGCSVPPVVKRGPARPGNEAFYLLWLSAACSEAGTVESKGPGVKDEIVTTH